MVLDGGSSEPGKPKQPQDRAPWEKPILSRLHASAAENNEGNQVSDTPGGNKNS
jgi:hypothetical protein